MRPVVVVMAVAVIVDEDETSSFISSPWTLDGAIDRGCLCDAAGHPHLEWFSPTILIMMHWASARTITSRTTRSPRRRHIARKIENIHSSYDLWIRIARLASATPIDPRVGLARAEILRREAISKKVIVG